MPDHTSAATLLQPDGDGGALADGAGDADRPVVDGMTVAKAIRRGEVAVGGGGRSPGGSRHQRVRAVVATFQLLAGELRLTS